MIVLNRDLVGSMVPTYSCREVSEGASEGLSNPYQRALSDLVRFANTFDPDRFEVETGKEFPDESVIPNLTGRIGGRGESDLDFNTLRWAAWMLVQPFSNLDDDAQTGELLDRFLDAIHWNLTGVERKRSGCGPHEPWIGTQGQLIAEGQRRFWVTTGPEFDRDRMFDFVAGLMLRDYGENRIARSLGLYPPSYRLDDSGLVTHIFMIVIQGRDLEAGDDTEQIKFAEKAHRRLLDADLGILPSDDD